MSTERDSTMTLEQVRDALRSGRISGLACQLEPLADAIDANLAALESLASRKVAVPDEREKEWLSNAYRELHRMYGNPGDGNKVGLDELSAVSSALRRIGVNPAEAMFASKDEVK